MNTVRRLVLALIGLSAALPLAAHHSYALFDLSKPVTINGTAAKLEWRNPHIFVWMYVPDKTQKSGYQLYAFESGSLVIMARQGWNQDVITAGEKLSIEYLPLKSGEPGGALLSMTLADGRKLMGDPNGRQLMNQINAAGKKAQ